ncbi:MAG: ChbG/HpnK family deacetylase [Calditrichaeota bacterium]|nr:ChbG/HpnK family deacetylase [Calditrichota bacterium]
MNRFSIGMAGVVLVLILTVPQSGLAQTNQTLAQQMGYPADARLLIINADDFGMCHTENVATIDALKKGIVTSATIMVPCPWFPEAANYCKQHPNVDAGVHLTLTSEWEFYRWPGVLSKSLIPSLLDSQGYFWQDTRSVETHAKGTEALQETRAQIERALAFGVDVTHIDSHMGAHYGLETGRTDILQGTMELAREFGLPFRLPLHAVEVEKSPKKYEMYRKMVQHYRDQGFAILDYLEADSYDVPVPKRFEYYKTIIKNLKPGVTEIIIHCGLPTDEMKAVTTSWDRRTADHDIFTDPRMLQFIQEQGVKLIGWRTLRDWQRRQMGWQEK